MRRTNASSGSRQGPGGRGRAAAQGKAGPSQATYGQWVLPVAGGGRFVPWRRPLPLVVLVLATALSVAGSPAAADPEPLPSAEVDVGVDRMVFVDGVEAARFALEGMCLPADDDVLVDAAWCSEEDSPQRVEGRVRKARLGFDAVRKVEAVPVDVPAVQTGFAGAPEQLTVVHVTLHEPGDLSVRVTGHREPGLNPMPVAGSASAGGEIEDRSVVWEVEGAEPGQHEFSVRFEPRAQVGLAGRFVPEIVVERGDRSSIVLDNDHRAISAADVVDRTLRLAMRQVFAPRYGPPAFRADDPWPAGGAGPPMAFGTSLGFDAFGDYDTAASPHVGGCMEADLRVLAPDGVGHLNTASMGTTGTYITAQRKYDTSRSWLRDEDGTLLGFEMCGQTTAPVQQQGILGTGTGLIWDGDGQVVSGRSGFHNLRRGEEREPQAQGMVRPDGGDAVLRGWLGLWSNRGPKHEQDKRVRHTYAAVVPMVVVDGDIDNRDGASHVEGEPWTFQLPSGQCGALATLSHVFLNGTAYQPDTSWDPSPGSDCSDLFTVTPRVGPGGYWQESSGGGYEREWANVSFVNLTTTGGTGEDEPNSVEAAFDELVVVPTGAAGTVQLVSPDGILQSIDIGPGVWAVEFTPAQGLRAEWLGAAA